MKNQDLKVSKFKKTLIFLCLAINAFSQTNEVILKTGTTIFLETSQNIDSKKFKGQQSIDLIVRNEVKVKDKILIPAGSIAKGVVVMSKPARNCGKAGQIEIKAVSVTSIDGQTLPLSSLSISVEGDNKKALAWGLSAGGCFVISPLSFFFLLIKGEEAEINSRTTLDARILTDAKILVE
jgi:hypothetical protein